MKKILLTTSVLAALISSGTAFADTNKNFSTGTITFTGEITNVSCSFDNSNATVDLGKPSALVLTKDGDSSPLATTELIFSKCELGSTEGGNSEIPVVSQVAITVLEGTPVPNSSNPNLWKVNGSAENVGLEVQIADKVIPVAGLSAEDAVTVDLVKAGNKVKVGGKIVATGKATPGSVNAVVEIVATFK